MAEPRYVVGIDLGTTNSALAYADLKQKGRTISTLPVPQLVHEGQVGERPSLPSFQYLAGEHELPSGSLALPWDPDREYAVGEFARVQGARVPGRLITSAKSWLCHAGVDRQARILPWGADDEVRRISPVEASSRYLQHLREAWQARFPRHPLADQDVILTVPASFDEAARELTVQAAADAGLPKVILLEEPQAACYAWVDANDDGWQGLLAETELILVVDIGGGTTDFSLVSVDSTDATVRLERTAVGDHLLLGGDNIDVALARSLEPQLGRKLDSQRWHALTNLCRTAKEDLLGPEAPEETAVRLVGRGSSVVGGTVSGTLRREEVQRIVVDGFFPACGAGDAPRHATRAGLQEWGLPFAEEPEVSRHLAAFLRRHADPERPWPDALLFNGGTLKPKVLRDRLRDTLAAWRGAEPAVLTAADLDLAVARGATYYGLVRRGRGTKIRGGSARAFYLGLAGTTDDGETLSTLCIAHRGMEEGEEVEVSEPEFEVLTNRPVSFPLYSSSTRLGDVAGGVVEVGPQSVRTLPPIRTALRFGRKSDARRIPVTVRTRLTEVGTLEVWCESKSTDHRWRLQLQYREASVEAEEPGTEAAPRAESVISPDRLEGASTLLRRAFAVSAGGAAGDPVRLGRDLEECLGAAKEAWPLDAIRKLWDVLYEVAAGRQVDPDREARWLNLCGFFLRPGFGDAPDDWRIRELWRLRSSGLRFDRAPQCRAEWWNMWKRVAGGLERPQQLELHREVSPWLLPDRKGKKPSGPRPGPQEIREYWQLMGNCERLDVALKNALGDVLFSLARKGKAGKTELWSLGRIGARVPFYGPLNCVVSRSKAEEWVEGLLAAKRLEPRDAFFPLVQLARCTGDRERDLDEGLRERIATLLRPLPAGDRAARVVTEVVEIGDQERARILDESLPSGLRIAAS